MTWPITHTTTIKGLRRIGQMFGREFADNMKNDLSMFLQVAGEEAQSTAQGLAPERTGYLKRHIQARVFTKADSIVLRFRSTAPYSWYVEKGVKKRMIREHIGGKAGAKAKKQHSRSMYSREHHAPAHQFMRPAIAQLRQRIAGGVREALAPAIESLGRRTVNEVIRKLVGSFK